MNRLLNRIIEYSFYVLFIIVPLILTPYNYELFEFNKMLTVYFLTTIITGAWIIKMILGKKIIFKRTPFEIPLILFLTSQIVSTLFSIDPHTSVWGYYSRFHGGLMSTISYLLLYFAYTSNLASKKRVSKNSIKVIISTAIIISIYGILEHFGIDKDLWVQDVQRRVFSTLGQPNWLAAYLLAIIPISLSLSVKKPKNHLVTLILFITLLFTKSRSGILGLSLAWVIYWSLILFKNKIKGFPFKPFLIINSLALLAIIIIGTPFTPSVKSLFDKKPVKISTPALSDLGPLTIQVGGSKSSDIRKVVWKGAIDVWKRYPIIGSGVETFAYSYYNHRPAEHNLLSEWDFLYNKAHNEFLNFLATTGIFGLFTYLLIILWFTIYCLKNLKENPLIPALLAGYWGLAVSNFFGFAVVPVALFFFLFPALAIKKSKAKDSDVSSISALQIIYTILTISTATLLLLSIINLWRADRQFILGKNYLSANQVQTGYTYLQKAVNLKPNEPLFRSLYSEAAAKMALLYHQNVTSEQADQATVLRDQLIEEAISNSDLVISQNRVHLNFYKSRAKVFFLIAQIDKQYRQDALDTLLKAIDLSPTDPKLLYNLGLLYTQLGQTDLAEQILIKSINLKPNYESARYSLGSLYQQLGQFYKAFEQYEYVLEFINPENQDVIEKLDDFPALI